MGEEIFVELTPETYDAFVTDAQDCIVLAHKKLCPHCKIMGTVLAKLKGQQPGLSIGAVDSELHPELLARLEVERVPTLCVIKGGEVKKRQSGILNPKEVAALYQNA